LDKLDFFRRTYSKIFLDGFLEKFKISVNSIEFEYKWYKEFKNDNNPIMAIIYAILAVISGGTSVLWILHIIFKKLFQIFSLNRLPLN